MAKRRIDSERAQHLGQRERRGDGMLHKEIELVKAIYLAVEKFTAVEIGAPVSIKLHESPEGL